MVASAASHKRPCRDKVLSFRTHGQMGDQNIHFSLNVRIMTLHSVYLPPCSSGFPNCLALWPVNNKQRHPVTPGSQRSHRLTVWVRMRCQNFTTMVQKRTSHQLLNGWNRPAFKTEAVNLSATDSLWQRLPLLTSGRQNEALNYQTGCIPKNLNILPIQLQLPTWATVQWNLL